jgi:hypothetical protein
MVVGIAIAIVLLALGAGPMVAIGAGVGWTLLAFAVSPREPTEAQLRYTRTVMAMEDMAAIASAARPRFAAAGLYLLATAGRLGNDVVMASKPVDGVVQTWIWRGELLLGPYPDTAFPHDSTAGDAQTILWMYLTVGQLGHVERSAFGMDPVRMLGKAPAQPMTDPAVLRRLMSPPTARLAG